MAHMVLETGKMITIPITAGIVGEVVRTKALRNVADTSKDRRVICRSAKHSVTTDPTPCVGAIGLVEWHLYRQASGM